MGDLLNYDRSLSHHLSLHNDTRFSYKTQMLVWNFVWDNNFVKRMVIGFWLCLKCIFKIIFNAIFSIEIVYYCELVVASVLCSLDCDSEVEGIFIKISV